MPQDSPVAGSMRGSAGEVFWTFLRLGLTAFGGPVAHLGYFREEFVARRRWMDERTYADLVALCQLLPGPASSQAGIAIGLSRAGLPGGVAAWAGFTLPSAIALTVFALLLRGLGVSRDAGWLHGLKIVAVAVVAQAVWSMGRNLCPDAPRASLAVLAAVAVLLFPGAGVQLAVIAAGAVAGAFWLRLPASIPESPLAGGVSRRTAIGAWLLFFLLLGGLPILARATGSNSLAVFDAFYRAGALVFGGGHVVLPLLQAEVVSPGWIGNSEFLAGYGAAQAVPGPLFTFAAYLGAVLGGVGGAAWCTVAIFLPAFLLVLGALPFWEGLRGHPHARSALAGVNAAVVGVLLAALYHPVFTSAVRAPSDLALALAAFASLVFWKVSPLPVVVAGAIGGAMLAWF